ncbi:hypothetical protein U9M48_008015 [Paspalum notatum var. saurae]|uniref:non-specific serine/threonine protein kinase n=1 Tax=Paspalum notatum var. saurae TaxID=547442 RepID=A0AAQ3WCU1_PASNO
MASDGGSSVEMELAWHLLTVLLRLGRPATTSELAAAAAAAAPSVSTRIVEQMCRLPKSPLRISGDGVVTLSDTAVLTFLRFVGWPMPAPKMSLRPSGVRQWRGEVTIRYERKRKGSDARCFSAKKRQLLAPDADLVEHRERDSHQLVAQTCAPAATGEVHLEVMQDLQDRLPTPSTFIGEHSLGFSTGVTLVHNVALCLQPKLDHPLGGDDGKVHGNMALALVPTDLSHCCSSNLPSLGAEKLENINTEVDGRSTMLGESEKVSFLNCGAEDSDGLQKESVHTTSNTVLVPETKDVTEEDLNLVCKNPGNPINYNAKTTDSIEPFDTILNQEDPSEYNCPDAGCHQNVPTCGQEKNPLSASASASACAEVCKDKIPEILFQPPMNLKDGPIAPQMNRNFESKALLQEATRRDSMNMRNLDIIAGNRGSKYLNHGEQPWNEAEVNVSKNLRGTMTAKQKERSQKNELPKEDKDRFAAKAQKGHLAPKPLPSFKGFVVKEEEGSGGYGTVYRAERKKDGRIFAIKCPHPNAHSHHVNNELKMLERFGGQNYVIKYECSLKSGDLDCFVLEHVEHDRPEILKRDIALLELQWYGYCLFRALASLHKQGVVHRDVKPGNFLFCRKLKKGYLIDFNLANDLHQKFLKNCKSEKNSCAKNTASQTLSTSAPVVHAKEAAADTKQTLPLKRKRSSRSPVGSAPKADNKSRHGSQTADVSGVTSAKDPTSTKTSLDRLKQPMPYKGRKEIMNYIHEVNTANALQSPSKNTAPAPVSQRKRVAAPCGSVDRKLFILTPMPLRSGGSAVAGSGIFNNKGNGKNRREGPCVGTKGFRAPEVLFRSFYQGCKVDVWSAGVTLLYLIIGRTPFGGDPEQNIKEIAKLKGSEELWEVAKLHNCESSYPSDLFDVKSHPSMDLREWCAANTRRPEFFKMIPDSLFDLVEKCLAVNPRSRLTSEDALRHEFFASCRDSFRKHKVPRPAGSDAACSSSHQNSALRHSTLPTIQTSLTPLS